MWVRFPPPALFFIVPLQEHVIPRPAFASTSYFASDCESGCIELLSTSGGAGSSIRRSKCQALPAALQETVAEAGGGGFVSPSREHAARTRRRTEMEATSVPGKRGFAACWPVRVARSRAAQCRFTSSHAPALQKSRISHAVGDQAGSTQLRMRRPALIATSQPSY